MTKRTLWGVAFIGILTLLMANFVPAFVSTVNTPTADASSHREAPLISLDPVADATDLYSFVSPERPDTVTFITNWIPFEVPASGPNWYRFGDDVLYEIHIDNVGDAQDHIAFQFRFQSKVLNGNTFQAISGPVESLNDPDYNLRQSMTVTRLDAPADGSCKNKPLANCATAKSTLIGKDIPVTPPNVGPSSFPSYSAVAAMGITPLSNGIKAFAGPRADSFFADIGSLFDLLTIRDFPGNKGGTGVDSFAGFNVHTISLQIPIKQLTKDGTQPTNPKDGAAVLGSWTTSSRRTTQVISNGQAPVTSGNWVQIQRLGMPLVNEAVVPLALKDAFNGLYPWQDATIPAVVNVITHSEAADLLHKVYNLNTPPAPRNDILTVFATGVPGLNQPPGVVPSEQLRLNVAIPPSNNPKRLGVLAKDNAGFPNGRRLNDDIVDITLRVVAGVLVEGYNVEPNNQLGDGVNKPFRPLMDEFPYQPASFSGYITIPKRAIPIDPGDD